MWNAIWVTAEYEQAERVIQALREINILTKCRMFLDGDQQFYEILVPSAETGQALGILAEF